MVSIIIPLYNRFDLIGETIESIIHQTNPTWELIIVDDGSTDGSLEIVKNYSSKDERIKIYQRNREPKGAPTCRNIGLEISRGKYIIFLDSDDTLAPWCIEERIKAFLENPQYDMLVFPMLIFNRKIIDSNILWNALFKSEDDLTRFLTFDSPWQTTSPIWRKETLFKIGKWTESLYGWDDWELHIRAILSNVNYLKLDTLPDFFLRRGDYESITNDAAKEKHLISKRKCIDKVMSTIEDLNKNNNNLKRLIMSIYYNQAKEATWQKNKLSKTYFESAYNFKLISYVRLFFVKKYLIILGILYRKDVRKIKALWFHLDRVFFPNLIYKEISGKKKGLFNYSLSKEKMNQLETKLSSC